MPTIEVSITLTAGQKVNNTLTGTFLEQLRSDGAVTIGITESSATETYGLVDLDFICGDELVMDNYHPRHTGTVATPPVIPDDMKLSCGAFAGDRIILKAHNRGAVTHNLIATVMFQES